MNELQIFENIEFGSVRTIEVDGKIYFVASDICKALEIANTTQAVQRLDDDEKSMLNIGLSGGVTNCINEYGLYNLVLASRKKGAKDFKRWITHEVIPSIRKRGMYAREELLNNPDLLISVAQELKMERERNRVLKTDNDRMKPKEIFADAVSASDTAILIGELAKILKQNGIDIGQNRLFEWMRENGYLVKRKGTDYNMPMQKSMEMGLFEIKERTIYNPDGSVRITKTVLVSGKGQQHFINRFLGGKHILLNIYESLEG